MTGKIDEGVEYGNSSTEVMERYGRFALRISPFGNKGVSGQRVKIQ